MENQILKKPAKSKTERFPSVSDSEVIIQRFYTYTIQGDKRQN